MNPDALFGPGAALFVMLAVAGAVARGTLRLGRECDSCEKRYEAKCTEYEEMKKLFFGAIASTHRGADLAAALLEETPK